MRFFNIKNMQNDPLCRVMELLGESDDCTCKVCGDEIYKFYRQWSISRYSGRRAGPFHSKCIGEHEFNDEIEKKAKKEREERDKEITDFARKAGEAIARHSEEMVLDVLKGV